MIDGSLTGADIAANSLTGEHIVNGSLTQAHFRDAPRLLAAGGGSIILKDGDTATVMAQVTLLAAAAGQVLINASGVFTVTSDSGAALGALLSCHRTGDSDAAVGRTIVGAKR